MKKAITTITLAAVLMLGSSFANAGILVSDRDSSPCAQQNEGIIVLGREGIIVLGREGIFVLGIAVITGINVARSRATVSTPCSTPVKSRSSREGILVGD